MAGKTKLSQIRDEQMPKRPKTVLSRMSEQERTLREQIARGGQSLGLTFRDPTKGIIEADPFEMATGMPFTDGNENYDQLTRTALGGVQGMATPAYLQEGYQGPQTGMGPVADALAGAGQLLQGGSGAGSMGAPALLTSQAVNNAADAMGTMGGAKRGIVTQSYKVTLPDGSTRWEPGTFRANPQGARFDPEMTPADLEQHGYVAPDSPKGIVTASYKETLDDGTTRWVPGLLRGKRPPKDQGGGGTTMGTMGGTKVPKASGITAYHGTYSEPFTSPDFNRLGKLTEKNAVDFDQGSRARNLATLGFWSHERPLEKTYKGGSFLKVKVGGEGEHFGSLDELNSAIDHAGGPDAFRGLKLREGKGHISVTDDEFGGGKSYVSLSPETAIIEHPPSSGGTTMGTMGGQPRPRGLGNRLSDLRPVADAARTEEVFNRQFPGEVNTHRGNPNVKFGNKVKIMGKYLSADDPKTPTWIIPQTEAEKVAEKAVLAQWADDEAKMQAARLQDMTPEQRAKWVADIAHLRGRYGR